MTTELKRPKYRNISGSKIEEGEPVYLEGNNIFPCAKPNQEDLPITNFLEKEYEELLSLGLTDSANKVIDIVMQKFILETRKLEQSSQEKIREEERERIVGILDELIEKKETLFKTEIDKSFINQSIFTLQEVKERILSQ